MGCDIHNRIEYRREIYIGKNEDGSPKYETKWCCGDYFELNPNYGVWNGEEEYELVGFCDERWYARFATLANVRNYGDTEYICEPKGLPDDVSEKVKEDYEKEKYDAHSISYFTLQELIKWNKAHKIVRYKGMISPDAQNRLDYQGILPDTWCQGTNEEGWEWRTWEDENNVLDDLIDGLKKRANELNLIYDWLWENNYEEALEKSKNIRLIFWFDN